MEFVFIVFGHYNRQGENDTDILLITKDEDKKNQFIKMYVPDKGKYYKLSYGTFDIE